MMNELDRLKTSAIALARELGNKVAEADSSLEQALLHREELAAAPLPRSEVAEKLQAFVATRAKSFEATLQSRVAMAARKRNDGLLPESVPIPHGFNEKLDIDILYFFLSDIIDAKLGKVITAMSWPCGAADGCSEPEYQKKLDEADKKIDAMKQEYDDLQETLRQIAIKN